MSLLQVENLKVHFPIKGGVFGKIEDYVRAVDGVNLNIEKGQTYGLVGESGSGKTTTGRAVIGLNHITEGEVLFEGEDISKIMRKARSPIRQDIQMIFQDPYSSLNPRKRVYEIIAEPIKNFENLTIAETKKRVQELMEIVGLDQASLLKYPHQFSGGQRQRIGVARAIALHPKLIIADEPVSALDVSVQAQILNFMQSIQKDLDLTYIFISHDLGVIKHMCDRIGIMYKGRFVEEGTKDDVFYNPQHIYTKRLVAAIPDLNPNNREKQIKMRQEVKEEYDEASRYYFDDKGLAYNLQQITNTHFAALPEKG